MRAITEVFRLCDDYLTRWAAREQAMRRPAFDLKQWHTAALSLGPIGLDGLTEALARIGDGSG